MWSADQKSIYVTGPEKGSAIPAVWKWNVDGSNLEKFVDNCGQVPDVDPGGRYLLGVVRMEKTLEFSRCPSPIGNASHCFQAW